MARAQSQSKQQQRGKHARSASAKAAPRALRANEGRAREADPVEPLMDDTAGRDIAGVVIAVVAVGSFIAVVSPVNAPVAQAVASFYHLGFGLGAYVLPLGLLAFSACLFLRERTPLNPRTLVGAALIFIAATSLLSLAVPYTDLSTNGMFTPEALSTSGGYLGAFMASALQNALGKTIAGVVLVGMAVGGLVVIGFSISSFMQAAAERAHRLAERRHVDVNDAPWGDEAALGGAAVPGRAGASQRPAGAQAKRQASQAELPFDDARTTFLGDRETTVLPIDDDVDQDEDPFVDVSDQLAAERAETTLIPVPDTFVDQTSPVKESQKPDEVPQAPAAIAAKEDRPPSSARKAAGDGASRSTGSVETASGLRPIPEFLMARAAQKSETTTVSALPEASGLAPAVPKPATKRLADHEEPAQGDADAEEGRTLPPSSMLRHNPHSASSASSEKELEQTAGALQSTLNEFGLHSQVVGWISGPTVTTFKVQPGEGERVSRISNLEDDIALSLAAQSVRIFAPIPGTSLVGIEIPNAKRQNVNLGDVLPYVQGGPLELAIGRDAEGAPIVADLAKMPHLLIAGTTGSGKSVMINSIIMALLMRTLPDDVRLIMVDPKRVELSGYNGLPHLYVPVVTEPKQAASALQWAVSEMERRLKVFERIGVRKISTFNEKQAAGEFECYDNPPAKMPYLVIIIDELSDLMMVAGKDVEASIVRIAQLGRAAGIHLIVATQRPSSNVVTGLIKANITNRIAFNVATGIDSRVIIDQMGAEKLTGYGDMLFSKVDWGKPKRIQGCFVSDDEINAVVGFVKEQGSPDYHEEILSAVAPASVGGGGGAFYNEAPSEDDPLLWDAAQIVVESQLGSTSGLQRRLKVGYARAGRIMDMLEEKGIVGPPDGSKPREVLYDEEGLAMLRATEERLSEEEIMGGM